MAALVQATRTPRTVWVRMNNEAAVAALSALAFETRLEVVRMLAAVGSEGLPAGEIARRLDVQQNTLSEHLRALARTGILTSERRSRSIIYRTDPSAMRDLVAYLDTNCLTPAASG